MALESDVLAGLVVKRHSLVKSQDVSTLAPTIKFTDSRYNYHLQIKVHFADSCRVTDSWWGLQFFFLKNSTRCVLLRFLCHMLS